MLLLLLLDPCGPLAGGLLLLQRFALLFLLPGLLQQSAADLDPLQHLLAFVVDHSDKGLSQTQPGVLGVEGVV